MKTSLRYILLIVLNLVGLKFAFADDFKSITIDANTDSSPIRVHGDQFMLIRNFTQEDGTTRGSVTATKPPSGGMPVMVLTAAALDAMPPDVINSVIIAGPADVIFHCGNTTGHCFASYKKESN